MLKETNIFSNFISKFLKGKEIVENSKFFKNKFINYYNINIIDIEKLIINEFNDNHLLAISLSDCESQIVLFSKGDDNFQKKIIENNKNITILINNFKILNGIDNFEEFMVTRDNQIDINIYIKWKRNFILYIIFDRKQTNLALANNRIKIIINNIKKILNYE